MALESGDNVMDGTRWQSMVNQVSAMAELLMEKLNPSPDIPATAVAASAGGRDGPEVESDGGNNEWLEASDVPDRGAGALPDTVLLSRDDLVNIMQGSNGLKELEKILGECHKFDFTQFNCSFQRNNDVMDSAAIKETHKRGHPGDEFHYNTKHNHRGWFLIINNEVFDKSTKMGTRTGTNQDRDRLKALFKTLGFDVVDKDNLTTFQMELLISDAAKLDHSDCDCFGVAILSHGDQGLIYGTDGTVEIEKLTAPLKQAKTLIGKPKLFFFQACRGEARDEGIQCDESMNARFTEESLTVTASDGPTPMSSKMIPVEADFLYGHATAPGYCAWRNHKEGAWYIQSLYKHMTAMIDSNKQLPPSIDILTVLTRVNNEVASKYEAQGAKKQIPSFVSMLTKTLYL